MEPKLKAIELFNKMVSEMPLQNNTNANVDYISKKCALIAVDEILKTNPYKARNYWHEVKTEIEKL
jgi:hypothetical protein